MLIISGCGQKFCTCATVPYQFKSSGYATDIIIVRNPAIRLYSNFFERVQFCGLSSNHKSGRISQSVYSISTYVYVCNGKIKIT